MKIIASFLGLLLMTGSCSDPNSADHVVADFSSLNSNSFKLKIEEIAESPDVQFPTDELKETDYVLLNDEKTYSVYFSEDGQKVSIDPGSIKGERTNLRTESLTYDLSNGLNAGGRFVVKINKKRFEAELTTYGSGIPIVMSERGELSK